MPIAPVNGIQLYYEVHGEGPSTIVFAHGAAGNHLVWFQQVPFFKKKYRCITFDHRGFHLSPDQPKGPGVASFVDDLRALLDYLGVEKTAIVAQSMSGLTGFGFAIAHPQRVNALVMSGTVQGIPSARLSEAVARYRKVHTPDKATDDNYATYFQERDPAHEFLYREITTLNTGYGKKQLGTTRPAQRPDSDLANLMAPVLFIFGADDEGIPNEVRQIAHSLIPGSRYVEVKGSGHSPYFERPEEFNRIVAGFFDDVGV
jgi:3-oxoadipate enol-lactonase